MQNIFGQALQETRESTGCSRKELSKKTKICVDTIKKYESKDTNPSLEKVIRIADALECGFGWDKKQFFFYPWQKTEEERDTFAEELKKIREEKGYSQKALAEKTGIRTCTIARYEIGKTHPSLGNVIKIAEALKCTFGWDRSKIWFSKAKKKKPKKYTDQDYAFNLFY